MGAIAIGAAASVGLSAVAVTKVSTLSEKFENLNNQQIIMMEALKQVTNNDKVEKLALKRLRSEITGMSDYVNELSETVGQMKKTLQTALIIMSKLGAQLSLTRSVLYEVSRKWEQ